VVDSSGEGHLWRLEWIIRWEMNGEEKDAPLVRAVRWTHYGGLPMEQVVSHRAGTALSGRVSTQILEFFVDPFECHFVVRGLADITEATSRSRHVASRFRRRCS